MTQNKRIVLNIVATYGRSLYSIALGLFAGRWTLQALGEVDFGLFGVIGGLVVFVSFVTWTIHAAIDRYLGVSIGLVRKDYERGINECQKWFSVSLGLLVIVAVVLMIIGYPLGVWAIENFLTIPTERIQACIWVWRFVCISTFIGFISLPFSAMYTAKQYIAELTIYSVVTATIMFCFQYYMVTHPGDWMVRLSLWSCAVAVAPQFIIAIRALVSFPECKFRACYLTDVAAFKELCMFSGWTFLGCMSVLSRNQGIVVLVNKYFGPSVNAAYQISNTVSGHASSLSSSMVTAFFPAVMNAYGEGDLRKAVALGERACKFGALLILLFALPLILEIDEVLHLWLIKPPQYTSGLCVLVLLTLVMDKASDGYTFLVNATGKIGLYNTINSIVIALALPIAWICVACGWSVYWTAGAILFTTIAVSFTRVALAAKVLDVGVGQWLTQIVLPIIIVSLLSLVGGSLVSRWLSPSFGRICLTTLVVVPVFFVLSWCFVLTRDEKSFVSTKVKGLLKRG